MTTNLANCKRLYELSGWTDTIQNRYVVDNIEEVHCGHEFKIGKELVEFKHSMGYLAPAYDSDYLLGKLPAVVRKHNMGYWLILERIADSQDGEWVARYDGAENKYFAQADTPSDALALLAIQLFENGVLKK